MSNNRQHCNHIPQVDHALTWSSPHDTTCKRLVSRTITNHISSLTFALSCATQKIRPVCPLVRSATSAPVVLSHTWPAQFSPFQHELFSGSYLDRTIIAATHCELVSYRHAPHRVRVPLRPTNGPRGRNPSSTNAANLDFALRYMRVLLCLLERL